MLESYPTLKERANVVWRDYSITIRGEKSGVYFDYDFVKRNEDEFSALYESLADDESRNAMAAYVNEAISADIKYLSAVRVPNQYFTDDIMHFEKGEVFIDCGAYIGDTAQEFIEALKRQGAAPYKEIVSFEPDKENYGAMKALKLPRHRCICKGVYDKPCTLHFDATPAKIGRVSGSISECGGEQVEVDSIDNVLQGGKATFIKMDIEGSEIPALHGASKTIKHYKPKLAICVYHKNDDLLTIPQYIKTLVPEYKFYLRAHSDSCVDLVLYAIA